MRDLRPMLALLLGLALGAVERAPVQPVLLPLPALLAQLDARQEWLLLSVDEWRALETAAAAAPSDEAATGAALTTAQITGRLDADGTLRLQARATAVAYGPGVRAVRLFAQMPSHLGGVTLGGQPALLTPRDGGVDLLLPGPGNHAVELSWSTPWPLVEGLTRRGLLVLPAVAAVELRIDTPADGTLSGAGIAPLAPGTWAVLPPLTSAATVAWTPGRSLAGTAGSWAVRQQVHLDLDAGTFAWEGTVESLRPPMPGQLDLRLPAGWRVRAAGAGVASFTEDQGLVQLQPAPGATVVSLSGWLTDAAVLALPQAPAAVAQGGIICLSGLGERDLTLPSTWRALGASDGQRRYVVTSGGAATLSTAQAAAIGTIVHQAELTISAESWRLDQHLTITTPVRRHAVTMSVPAGWSVQSATAAGASPVELGESSQVTLDFAAGLAPGTQIDLVLIHPAATHAAVVLAEALLPGHVRRRLLVATAPGLDAELSPQGWILGPQARSLTVSGVNAQAELLAEGVPGSVAITVRPQVPAAQVDAVAWLLPSRSATAPWYRVDLRIEVISGVLEDLVVTLPLDPATVRVEGLRRVEGPGPLRLTDAAPWRGARLVRIEGRLDATQTAGGLALPRLGLSTGTGTVLPITETLVLLGSGDDDARVVPAEGDRPWDPDLLPSFATAVPGSTPIEAWRRLGADAHLTMVVRALATLPTGVIDRLQLRSQVSTDSVVTLVTARVAAPGAQVLPLALPAGAELLAATIDGQAVAPRHAGEALALALPGRTQVEVALLYRTAHPERGVLLLPPRFGALAVSAMTWDVAVPTAWRVRPQVAAGNLAMINEERPAWRPSYRLWQAAAGRSDQSATVPVPIIQDARRLTQAVPIAPVLAEPVLLLDGARWRGTCVGSGPGLALELSPITALDSADRWGWALGLVSGLVLAWGGLRVALAGGLAGVAVAAALIVWQEPLGVVLGLAEALPIGAMLGLLWTWLGGILKKGQP